MFVLSDTDKMMYGAHKNKALANVPAHYLIWLHGEFVKNGTEGFYGPFNTALKTYIEYNMDSLRLETKNEFKKSR